MARELVVSVAHRRFDMRLCVFIALFTAFFFALTAGGLVAQSNDDNNNNNNNNNNDNNDDDDTGGTTTVVASGDVWRQAIGGVSLVDGVMMNASRRQLDFRRDSLTDKAQPIPPGLAQKAELRKISLKYLDQEIRRCRDENRELPDAVLYLGGLTAIHYVLADPENNDILLVGPAEGWKFDATGSLVGSTSGRPIMLLEDLVTLMRLWNRPQVSNITCSIDPTLEGRIRVEALKRNFIATRNNAEEYVQALEEAFGMNEVRIEGLPRDCRIARIMAAADYKLKQIGLGMEDAPKGVVSYLSLVNPKSQAGANPRFWLVPDYGTISHDESKLTWDISACSVKALTESDYYDIHGRKVRTESSSRPAMRWAEIMTRDYGKVGQNDPVFADLNNCMQMATAVALIYKENFMQKTQCRPDMLYETHAINLPRYEVPEKVRSIGNIHKRNGGVVVGCGGVEINPWEILEQAKVDKELRLKRDALVVVSGGQWWSN